MAYQFSPAVERLIRAKMASGCYSSEEELVVEALQALDESEKDLQAIEDGLLSLDSGEEGASLDEAFSRLRQKHRIQDSP
jgi:Arc/MetJ-type ribon-helix-helix transcriptional regulator